MRWLSNRLRAAADYLRRALAGTEDAVVERLPPADETCISDRRVSIPAATSDAATEAVVRSMLNVANAMHAVLAAGKAGRWGDVGPLLGLYAKRVGMLEALVAVHREVLSAEQLELAAHAIRQGQEDLAREIGEMARGRA